MSIDFNYGGMPPAMARAMERPGSQPGLPSMPVLSLPEIPRQQSMQMPTIPQGIPAPQAQQMQGVNLGSMPQSKSPYQNANPMMPDPRGGAGAYAMPDMNSWMAQRQQVNRTNIGIIDSQKARAQQMNMGRQDMGGGDMADMKVSKGLGALSAKYESNGNPGTVAHTKGDIGGASYGSYQLSASSGNAAKFAGSYGGQLKGKKPGTAAFDAAWKAEAKKNPKAFQNAQHKYIENNHYKPAASNIKKKTGFDVNKYPKAVQDAVWSMGVQHGAGGAASIFRSAGVKNGMSAENVLRKTYTERMKVDKYFKSTKDPAIKANVKKRFQKELEDALKML